MSNSCFRPKAYGYGATPLSWKGWAATLAYAAMLTMVSLVLPVWQATPGTGPSASQIAAWALAVLALSMAFVGLAYAKTDGQWGWRWGK
jgi:uncharacterized membrane protein